MRDHKKNIYCPLQDGDTRTIPLAWGFIIEYMLQAKTEEQKARIKEILGATSTWEGGDDGI